MIEYGYYWPELDSERFTDPDGQPYTRKRATEMAVLVNGSLLGRDVSPSRVLSIREV